MWIYWEYLKFLEILSFCYQLTYDRLNTCEFYFFQLSTFFSWHHDFQISPSSDFLYFFINYIIVNFILLFIYSILLYFLWYFLKKKLKFKFIQKIVYDNKVLFYIFFIFVPILWNFWTFLWWFLSNKIEIKKDLLKIFLWNFLFIFFVYVFWKIILTFYNI